MKAQGKTERVLFVEDDAVIAVTMSAALRREGYELMVANSVAEAATLVRSHRFDVAVLDMLLPDGRGTDIAPLLREQGCNAIVVLTAFSEAEMVDAAAAAGSMSFLVKPVSPRQLQIAVDTTRIRAAEMTALQQDNVRLASVVDRNQDVGVATGIVMERLKMGRTEAFETLRTEARSHREKLARVAERVIDAAEALKDQRQPASLSPVRPE